MFIQPNVVVNNKRPHNDNKKEHTFRRPHEWKWRKISTRWRKKEMRKHSAILIFTSLVRVHFFSVPSTSQWISWCSLIPSTSSPSPDGRRLFDVFVVALRLNHLHSDIVNLPEESLRNTVNAPGHNEYALKTTVKNNEKRSLVSATISGGGLLMIWRWPTKHLAVADSTSGGGLLNIWRWPTQFLAVAYSTSGGGQFNIWRWPTHDL